VKMAVRQYVPQVPYGIVKSTGVFCTSVVEKPTCKCFINAGLYLFESEITQQVTKG